MNNMRNRDEHIVTYLNIFPRLLRIGLGCFNGNIGTAGNGFTDRRSARPN